MTSISPSLMQDIRARFAHVDVCPLTGPRIFFENAGGALTLNSVVESSAKFAAIPDNQGRDNAASAELGRIIAKAKADALTFFGAEQGHVFVGESGTEMLFRLIRSAAAQSGSGRILGSSVEHPASRSACARWAEVFDMPYDLVPHDVETGTVLPEGYAELVRPDTRVATILHSSPVTGMRNDVAACAAAIRAVAPECFIIVDGIQYASHGGINIDSYDIDGYVISPYKVFSRHGYGVAWMSDRLAALPHENLKGGPELAWEFGTRDTGSYATFSDVVEYFAWLGAQVSAERQPRALIAAAGDAIHAHEKRLTDAMLFGDGNLKGLSDLPGTVIVGGADNPARAGLVSVAFEHMPAADMVAHLNARGIRVHIRKADHYSGNILDPMRLQACIRVSLCHYNTLEEVREFLHAVSESYEA